MRRPAPCLHEPCLISPTELPDPRSVRARREPLDHRAENTVAILDGRKPTSAAQVENRTESRRRRGMAAAREPPLVKANVHENSADCRRRLATANIAACARWIDRRRRITGDDERGGALLGTIARKMTETCHGHEWLVMPKTRSFCQAQALPVDAAGRRQRQAGGGRRRQEAVVPKSTGGLCI